MIRYYVSGIGFNNNDCVTDDEWDFGDFDTYEEAEAKSISIDPGLEKRKCGNCW